MVFIEQLILSSLFGHFFYGKINRLSVPGNPFAEWHMNGWRFVMTVHCNYNTLHPASAKKLSKQVGDYA